jgi:phage terminase large subunit
MMVRFKTRQPAVNVVATFDPLSWQVPAWRDTSAIVLLTGAAGGGKSRIAAEKLHGFCLRYPNAMAMVLRKERSTLTNSTLPMLEREVIGADPRVKHFPSRHRYEYTNGSTLVYGGMADDEQRENVRSMSLDIVWMEEATRFNEPDFNELLARMRGNAANWRQIVLTTNPDAPSHWIKRRLIDNLEAHVYMSAAADNPHNPEQYHAALESMTGIQRQRLLEGRWTQAEGVIYDNWALENIAPDADYHPDYGAIYWGMDDGYVYGGGPGTQSYHPRVVLMAQITPVGGLNVFAEYYRTLELAETTITNVRAMGYPDPDIVYVDSSAAELRGRLSGVGLMNVGATHVVSEGIKTLRRMICDGNGQRLFRVHPRCANLIRELQTYRYADSTAGVNAGEPKPDKVEDHGPDSARYLAYSLRHLGA